MHFILTIWFSCPLCCSKHIFINNCRNPKHIILHRGLRIYTAGWWYNIYWCGHLELQRREVQGALQCVRLGPMPKIYLNIPEKSISIILSYYISFLVYKYNHWWSMPYILSIFTILQVVKIISKNQRELLSFMFIFSFLHQ